MESNEVRANGNAGISAIGSQSTLALENRVFDNSGFGVDINGLASRNVIYDNTGFPLFGTSNSDNLCNNVKC